MGDPVHQYPESLSAELTMKTILSLLVLVFFLPLIASEKYLESVSVSDFQKAINEEEGTLLDVRSPKEHKAAAIANSSLLNYFEEGFWDKIAELPKEKTYFVYCASGGRSGKTLNRMKELGFLRVFELSGGMRAWQAAGLPVVK